MKENIKLFRIAMQQQHTIHDLERKVEDSDVATEARLNARVVAARSAADARRPVLRRLQATQQRLFKAEHAAKAAAKQVERVRGQEERWRTFARNASKAAAEQRARLERQMVQLRRAAASAAAASRSSSSTTPYSIQGIAALAENTASRQSGVDVSDPGAIGFVIESAAGGALRAPVPPSTGGGGSGPRRGRRMVAGTGEAIASVSGSCG